MRTRLCSQRLTGPRVTIVVATWNRPDALRAAVLSAIRQTFEEWRMFVVGDGCDERTGKVVAALADTRVAYVNLPARFGEQAGPNSVGFALSDTPFVAILNHDDYWLPDHLERAVGALAGPADLYISRSARAKDMGTGPDGPVPLFEKVNPRGRRLRHAYIDGGRFEPASAWAFRRELAERVGPWRLAREIFRAPADDWLIRAWRAGARTRFDPAITVLRMITHYRHERPDGCYAAPDRDHAALLSMVARTTPDDLRRRIEETARPMGTSGFVRLLRRPLRWVLVNSLTSWVYRGTGLDAFSLYCRITGRPRGEALRRASRRRTGADLPDPPDREAMVAEARRILSTGNA